MGSRERAADHFGRLNAFVDNGWLAVLSPLEIAVWIAYEKFADPDGKSYPGGELLRQLLGHASDGHVSKPRQSLVARGLFELVEAGGGRGRPCVVRVLVPGPAKPSQIGRDKPSGFGRVSGAKPSRFGALNPPDSARKPSRYGAPYKEEQPIEQPKEHKSPADEPRGADETSVRNARATKPGKPTERVLSDEQRAVWEAFRHWYTFTAFPAKNHGEVYEFKDGRDGKAVMEILRSRFVGFSLDRAKALGVVFLREPDEYLARRGHNLYDLAERLNRFTGKAAELLKGRASHGTNGTSTNPIAVAGPTKLRQFGVAKAHAG